MHTQALEGAQVFKRVQRFDTATLYRYEGFFVIDWTSAQSKLDPTLRMGMRMRIGVQSTTTRLRVL